MVARDSLWTLVVDNNSVTGKFVTTGVVVAVAVVLGAIIGRLFARRTDDRYRKYYARKVTHYVVAVVAAIALGIVWRPFAGQLGLVVGLSAAGLAFAMQELIGALAGWFNIVSGSIYRVGDRVQLADVRGDVIDITPLRTKIMEIGSTVDDSAWVRGRQYTGRIVAVSNKVTFTDPVFNFSATFEFIWEEVTIPIAYRDDWHAAEDILRDEAIRISASVEAEAALNEMVKRYPVARTEIEPRVFIRSTDNYLELAARFVVPVRQARFYNDEFTRHALDRLARAGIHPASQTTDITILRSEASTDEDQPVDGDADS